MPDQDAKQMEINLLRDSYVESVLKKPQEKKPEPDFTKPENSATEKALPSVDLQKEKPAVKEPELKVQGFFSNPEEISGISDDSGDISRFAHVREPKVTMVQRKPQREPVLTNESIIKVEEKTPVVETEEKSAEKGVKALVCDVDFRLVGQVFGTFIIVQIDNEMIVIDQHAAHERIYFEELLEEFRSNTVDSQLMLLPVTMTLSPIELNVALSEKEFFSQIGFEIDDFGQNSIVVRSTPGTMEEQDIKDCVSEIIGLLSSHKNDIPVEISEEALHMIACKRALKGNKVLSEKEQKALAEQVLSLGEGINTCPHGRPIMIKMSKYSLEKQFKRIV